MVYGTIGAAVLGAIRTEAQNRTEVTARVKINTVNMTIAIMSGCISVKRPRWDPNASSPAPMIEFIEPMVLEEKFGPWAQVMTVVLDKNHITKSFFGQSRLPDVSVLLS